jgi:hypothetical protein
MALGINVLAFEEPIPRGVLETIFLQYYRRMATVPNGNRVPVDFTEHDSRNVSF